MATTTITIGDRQFILDKDKAEAAFAAKKVINGRQTMFFKCTRPVAGLRTWGDNVRPRAAAHRNVYFVY